MGGSLSRTPVLKATCGPVIGVEYLQENGRIVEGFLGIPYAKPPVGNLRFKKPIAHDKWEEARDCARFGPRAPQNDELLGYLVNTVGKSEADCLSLNVFTPNWRPSSSTDSTTDADDGFPVMVFIHGGGFAIHSSSNYGCSTIARNLCTKNVVVVTINYRLGVLGFFTTGDENCRGNFGLWDQTLALQWIQAHIRSFRGDPNNVTVFGQSAGGASTDLLCLSPHSRDLFHRAIPMAGSGECDFAMRTNEQQAKLSKEFARYIGWTGDDNDSADLLNFINSEPLYKIELGINPKKGFRHSQSGSLYFVPNYDGDFFPAPISELRKTAPRKEIMTGTTMFEGLFFVPLGAISRTPEGLKRFLRKNFKECDYGEKGDQIMEMVHNFYMKDIDPKDTEKFTLQLVKLIGDHSITYGTYKTALINSQLGNDVYFYCFEYFNPHGFGIFKYLFPFLGSTHCTELRYIVGKGLISKFKPNEEDKQMLEMMTTFFTNFAKYGNPNGKNVTNGIWEKHDPTRPFRHFRITLNPEMSDDFQDRRAAFWESIREHNITRSLL